MWHHSDLFEICKSPLGTSIPISNFHTSRTNQDFSQTLPGLVIQMRQENCAPERRVAKVVVEPPNGTHQKYSKMWSLIRLIRIFLLSSSQKQSNLIRAALSSWMMPMTSNRTSWIKPDNFSGNIVMHMSSILKLYKIKTNHIKLIQISSKTSIISSWCLRTY